MNQDSNDADIISSLHDSVIRHIMSRLSSRDAVRTSVLSEGWRYKWTSADNIDIHDRDFLERSTVKDQMFINFMDMILELPRHLKSIRIICHAKYTGDCYTRWISAALRRNIEIFELQKHYHQSFVVPISLLNNSTSLRTLKLTGRFKVPGDTKFPYLTELYLEDVEILNEQSDRVVLTFPVLKTLVLIGCKWRDVDYVDIYSPKLRIFKCETWGSESNFHLITIHGARLDIFETDGIFPEQILLDKSTVHTASLQGCPSHVESGVQYRRLLRGFSNLVKLQLSVYLCEVLAGSSKEIEVLKFDRLVKPRFDRLLQLEMSIGGNSELLFEFLNSSPSLEFLKFNDGMSYSVSDGNSKIFDFAEVDSVPECVKSHLKEVVFINIPYNPLLILAEYFLKHGLKLEKVYIEDDNDDKLQGTAVIERLRNFPKASAVAQIFPPGSIF